MTKSAIIIGMDRVTAGLAARLLLNGWQVRIEDEGDASRTLFGETLALARKSLPALRDFSIMDEGEIRFGEETASADNKADLILVAAGAAADGRTQMADITMPTAIVCDANGVEAGDNGVSIHLMEPSYLLPLAEICGPSEQAGVIADHLETAGLAPVITHVAQPVLPHLLSALEQEMRGASLGVPAAAIGDLLMFGPALVWAQQGLAQNTITGKRDEALVAMLRALKARDSGAGRFLKKADKRPNLPEDWSKPLITLERVIPVDWTDYNGHMNESRYGQVFSDAGDTVMMLAGADQSYIDSGYSYFTVYNNITYLAETNAGDPVFVRSQVLQAQGKKLRMHHEMLHEDGRLLATCTQLLIHVSLETRRSCEPSQQVLERLARLHELQTRLPPPASLKE